MKGQRERSDLLVSLYFYLTALLVQESHLSSQFFSFWTFIRNNTNLTQISIFEKNGKILLRCTLLLVLLGLKVSSQFAKERIPQEWPYELTQEKFMKVSCGAQQYFGPAPFIRWGPKVQAEEGYGPDTVMQVQHSSGIQPRTIQSSASPKSPRKKE